ncbi:hypothetical protein [Tunturiibacter lichenicola]|jgi:hypothetical protein|uniref:hypothetical protein n=1 Tax=Tunturiibacter lichenicola TaxID=2051959 RepID=UPI003D9B1F2B
MLPNDDKPWAKGVARTVICLTIVALACLTYYLQSRDMLHISEIVGIVLLFLTIVPPNLAVLYPWLLTGKHTQAKTRP